MYNVMTVAYELRQPLSEVSQWPIEEIQHWLAYFKVRNALQAKANKRNRSKSKIV